MQAMIFAAGLGTRLRPLTDTKPKALVEINGKTLLERNIEKMVSYGIKTIVVNIHHFPDMMREFIQKIAPKYDCNIIISDERAELLDTGGGFLNARKIFEDGNLLQPHPAELLSDKNLLITDKNFLITDKNSTEHYQDFSVKQKDSVSIDKNLSINNKYLEKTEDTSEGLNDGLILLHNVDILSEIDFNDMRREFLSTSPLALLAVQKRDTQRYLIFNEDNELCGWTNMKTNEKIITRKCRQENLYAFSGVHLVSNKIFGEITQKGVFSITDMYLNLSKNYIIKPYIYNGLWIDTGRLSSIEKAERMF